MLTAIETVTEAYLRDAEPSITLIASRPAQAQVRMAQPLPWPYQAVTIKTSIPKNDSTTRAIETGLGLDVAPSSADAAVAQILKFEKFDADWDGSEAAKPLDYSLKEARSFIRKLAPESVIPRPALHADGHAILFVKDADAYAELEFMGNNKISYYARRGGEKWSGEIIFDGGLLPEGLSRIGLSL